MQHLFVDIIFKATKSISTNLKNVSMQSIAKYNYLIMNFFFRHLQLFRLQICNQLNLSKLRIWYFHLSANIGVEDRKYGLYNFIITQINIISQHAFIINFVIGNVRRFQKGLVLHYIRIFIFISLLLKVYYSLN